MIAGCFKLIDSQGIPLSMLLQEFKNKNLVVDWDHFLSESIAYNWKFSSTLSKIQEAVAEVHGPKYAHELNESCRRWFEIKGQYL